MAFLKKWFGTQEQSHLMPHSDSERAKQAWKDKFGGSELRLVPSDPEPFAPGRRLGGGGVGIVYETHLGGVALALKRTYARKLSKRDLNEVKIMGQLSERRHEHIVQLIGSYVHRQRNGYEIGLLMFPVAHCDLACFMHKMDALKSWILQPGDTGEVESEHELRSATELLSVFWAANPNIEYLPVTKQKSEFIYNASQRRLCQSLLCISRALSYLHQNKIRHKDLKPSQILLSPNGLWLADFGYSNDMSAYSNSATSDWDLITYRYQAPERAAKGSCSRPEDVFALACTFLEMSVRLTDSAVMTIDCWKAGNGGKWSFQENLADIEFWLAPLRTAKDVRIKCLADLICQMMSEDPKCRPKIAEVIDYLSQQSFGEETPPYSFGSFLNPCCRFIDGVSKLEDGGPNLDNMSDHQSQPSSQQQTCPQSRTEAPSLFEGIDISSFNLPALPPRTAVEERHRRSIAPQQTWQLKRPREYRWTCCACSGDNSKYDVGCSNCSNHWKCKWCTIYEIY